MDVSSGLSRSTTFCLQRARSSRVEHSAFNRVARVRSPPSPPYFSIGASSSGRTSRFERENPGSNPGAPATRHCECHVNSGAGCSPVWREVTGSTKSHGAILDSASWRNARRPWTAKAQSVRGAIFNAPIAQLVERLVEAQEAAESKPARCTTSCWPVAQLAEHSAVTGDAAGSSPAWPAITEVTHSTAGWTVHSRWSERRSYQAAVLGSISNARTTHATLAQLDQSAGLRSRRSKVQLLHVAPHCSSMNHE